MSDAGPATVTADRPERGPAPPAAAEQAGLAHVATASFLASRVVPTGGYAIALAGGVALARAAQVAGMRTGYGASLAATLQAIAVMGPSRLSVPLTQGLSAPLLGRMVARGASLAAQLAACMAIRISDQVVTALFYIWIIVGGVDAYAATYDALIGRIPGIPQGPSAALVATAAGLVAWTIFASVVQVLVYRAALAAWPASRPRPRSASQSGETGPAAARARRALNPRYDPRVVATAAIVAFVVLVWTTAWPVLGAVAAWLAAAWATARGDRTPIRAGLALAALLAGGALVFGLVGGVDLDLTLQRTVRAALLVLVATWLRAAAGEQGLREVARRALGRLQRVPAMGEASAILDRLGATGALAASARTLVEIVRGVPRRPTPLAAAVLRWVANEAGGFVAPQPAPRALLRCAAPDVILVAVLAATVSAATLAL